MPLYCSRKGRLLRSGRRAIPPLTRPPSPPRAPRQGSPAPRKWLGHAFVLDVTTWLAGILQMMVAGLERLIEMLGQEPERRWENIVRARPVGRPSYFDDGIFFILSSLFCI